MTAGLLDSLIHIGKNAAIYGMGRAAGSVLSLLALPVFTAYMAPEEYGVIAILTMLGFVVESLFGLGVGATTGIVYYSREEQTHRDATIWSALAIACLSGIALLVLVGGASSLISDLLLGRSKWWLLVFLQLIIVVARLVFMPLLLNLQFNNRPLCYVCVSIFGSAFGLVAALLLVAEFGMGMYGWMIGNLCGSILGLGLGLLFALPLPLHVDPALMRRLLKLGYPIIPGAFFILVIFNSGPFFLKHLTELSEAGIFSVGYQMGMGITLTTAAITTAWYPFFQSYATRHAAGSEIFPRLATAYLIIFGFLTLLFFIFARPAVYMLANERFYAAYHAVGLIAAGQFLIGYVTFLQPGIYFSAETKWLALLQAPAAIITVLGHLVLIPLFKAEGAALAIVIGTASLVVMQLTLNRRRSYQVKMYEPGRTACIFSLIVLTCAAQRLIDASADGWPAAMASVVVILIYLASVWVILAGRERNAIVGLITNKLRLGHAGSDPGKAPLENTGPEPAADTVLTQRKKKSS